MTARAILAAMHAEYLTEALRLERASNNRAPDDPDAMQSRDVAAELRTRADAIRNALDELGGVYIAPPGQLSLFSDGGKT